jgi:uncharacterized protein YjiS (DUF1127 family)
MSSMPQRIHHPQRAGGGRHGWSRLWRRLERWGARRRQRRALRRLDGRALQDLGLSRADVEREAAKPFWRP